MSSALAKPYKLTAADKERASWLINAGQEDTERTARAMTGTEADVAILQHAIAGEKAKAQPRATRLKIMEGKLRVFLKTAKPLALQGESAGPDWSRARHLQERTKLAFRFALAGQILLGHELETLKIELGFMGSGRREKTHDVAFKSLNRTWDQHCKAELGMCDMTANRLIATYQAAKKKLAKLGGQPRLLSLLETKPDAMDAEDRNTLSAMVDKLEWGESQRQLLEEWHIAKAHKSTDGGDTSKPKAADTKPTAQQMAFAFFEPAASKAAEIAGKIGSLRIKQDYEAFLYQLDVASEDPKALTLDVLEVTQAALIRDASEFLADIRKAKAAKTAPPAA